MKPKELDCVLLKDGREVVILEGPLDGYYLVEVSSVEETDEPQFTITDAEIEKITYVA